MAGFTSGEGYKAGAANPYIRLHRAFIRQVIGLGGADQEVDSGPDQLGGMQPTDNVTFTFGKFSVSDIFDTNSYAHDPRSDFLNWSVVESGAFDYAADAWGYSVGAALEWNQSWWSLRGGAFNLSIEPNSTHLESDFSQYALIGEAEARHQWAGRRGKIKLLGFVNHGNMADYKEAVHVGQQLGVTPDAALVRRYSSRPGIAISLEQEITANLGGFMRASYNDGSKEAFDFTEINRAVSAGLTLKGNCWRRPDDTAGMAIAINSLSHAAQAYFAAGGLGILIGDGQLPHYDLERIFETYYSWRVIDHVTVTVDYQHINNPAYNPDRGPVSVFGLRVHADY